jgi:hypothetical protein
MQVDSLATPEFLLAEGARLADDQINLPAGSAIVALAKEPESM